MADEAGAAPLRDPLREAAAGRAGGLLRGLEGGPPGVSDPQKAFDRPIFQIFPDFLFFSDFVGRLQPLITAPENPQILVILCENEAIGGT